MENNKPIRVQRKRTKGYRMPENTVSVTRPGKFGNPFALEEEIEISKVECRKFGLSGTDLVRNTAKAVVVSRFRDMMLDINSHPVTPEVYSQFRYMRDRISDLQGKNLACYCNLGDYCHADVLLELANQP